MQRLLNMAMMLTLMAQLRQGAIATRIINLADKRTIKRIQKPKEKDGEN